LLERRVSRAFAFVLVVFAVVGASSGAAAQRVAHAASDSQESALGAALAARFDRERGLLPQNEQNRRIERYLQSVADSLGRHTRRHLPWTIHYDPHPGIHSGFALPGGHIVIWGGILSYMTTEDELAAIVAHEIAHIDDEQVAGRIDSLVRTKHRDVNDASQWTWQEFGESYGPVKENLCDYDGAKLLVKAGYSPLGSEMLLRSFIALGSVHAPNAKPPAAIVVRIDQIRREIAEYHWEALTKTRPLALPMASD
jgi:predicted Zn-dependent protease